MTLKRTRAKISSLDGFLRLLCLQVDIQFEVVKDHPTLVIGTLQLVELLLSKIPEEFSISRFSGEDR